MTKDEKLALLKLPLDEKIKRTKELILEWYLQYDGQVFVSFSGGKDSTVLLHIARSIKTCADIPAVFVDTGLEYPELRQHVKNTENVIWVKPKYTFKQVLEKYGYPIISKVQSRYIYDMRHSKSDKLKDVRMNGKLMPDGTRGSMSRLSDCWKPLIDAPFEISNGALTRGFQQFDKRDIEPRFPFGKILPFIRMSFNLSDFEWRIS